MNNKEYEITIGKDSVLFYSDNTNTSSSFGVRLGELDNILELNLSRIDNNIKIISCILVSNIQEKKLTLPSLNDLKERYNTPFFLENGFENSNTNDFEMYYNKNELNISFNNSNKIAYYSKRDRIEFFYDEDINICDLRIINLSQAEYLFLKNEERNPGAYLKGYDIDYFDNLVKNNLNSNLDYDNIEESITKGR